MCAVEAGNADDIGSDFCYRFGKRMKFFCTSLLSPDQLGRHCWTKRTAQSKSHSVRGRRPSETENVSSRFLAALKPVHAHQPRGWARMAIEARTKITGTITRQWRSSSLAIA